MVQAIAPQDETEAMLAVQMVAVHKATSRGLKARDAQGRDQEQTDANALIKLTRTFTAQVEPSGIGGSRVPRPSTSTMIVATRVLCQR